MGQKSELATAKEAWEKAPVHIKAMAGRYMEPILAVMEQSVGRLERLEQAVVTACGVDSIDELQGAGHGA